MNSMRALLSGLIDYAGMFPPAALDLTAAARNYDAYLLGEYSWILGRFVIPAARFTEVRETGWKLSVIGVAAADSIELKQDETVSIEVPPGTTAYYEIPLEPNPADRVATLASAGARAKIRMGGLTADMVPQASAVARFLCLAARARLPFKATAGLHHPLRSSASGMHGFLNLFLAAALVDGGGSEQDAVALLNEESPEAFHFDNEGVNWRAVRLTVPQIRATREQFAISFGSCSFEEPIADLKVLNLL